MFFYNYNFTLFYFNILVKNQQKIFKYVLKQKILTVEETF